MMTTTRRTRATALPGILAALLTAALAAGCSGSAPVTYSPAAYGVPGHCYYIQDPAEAIALENAGLCPRSWAPTLMPAYWHQEYYSYYSSPAYIRYVPARERAAYTTAQHAYAARNRAAISALSARARYKGSDGSAATGAKVAKAKARYGSGTSFGTTGKQYGGGSRGKGGTSTVIRSGPGSRSGTSGRTGGFGGGSRGGRR